MRRTPPLALAPLLLIAGCAFDPQPAHPQQPCEPDGSCAVAGCTCLAGFVCAPDDPDLPQSACKPCGEAADCDDGDPCTEDVCNPQTGACEHLPDPACICRDQTDCDPGQVCLPECFPGTGCGQPPAAFELSCVPETVYTDVLTKTHCRLDLGLTDQAACLACGLDGDAGPQLTQLRQLTGGSYGFSLLGSPGLSATSALTCTWGAGTGAERSRTIPVAFVSGGYETEFDHPVPEWRFGGNAGWQVAAGWLEQSVCSSFGSAGAALLEGPAWLGLEASTRFEVTELCGNTPGEPGVVALLLRLQPNAQDCSDRRAYFCALNQGGGLWAGRLDNSCTLPVAMEFDELGPLAAAETYLLQARVHGQQLVCSAHAEQTGASAAIEFSDANTALPAGTIALVVGNMQLRFDRVQVVEIDDATGP